MYKQTYLHLNRFDVCKHYVQCMSLSVNLTHLLFLLRLFVSNERSSCYCFVPYLYIYIQRITFAYYGFFFSLSGFSVFSEEPSNIRFICFFFFRGFCLSSAEDLSNVLLFPCHFLFFKIVLSKQSLGHGSSNFCKIFSIDTSLSKVL